MGAIFHVPVVRMTKKEKETMLNGLQRMVKLLIQVITYFYLLFFVSSKLCVIPSVRKGDIVCNAFFCHSVLLKTALVLSLEVCGLVCSHRRFAHTA